MSRIQGRHGQSADDGGRLQRFFALLRQDIVLSGRTFRRSPAFAAAAILSLAIGIGANAAVFGLVDAVLLQPVPVREPSRVAALQLFERKDGQFTPVSTDTFRDIRARQHSFTSIAAFCAFTPTLDTDGNPRPIAGLAVSGQYFDVIGIGPSLGRAIRPADDRDDSGDSVVVLSHRFWRQSFGGDVAVLGRTIRLNGQPFAVIGVTPESFRGTTGLADPDVYLPLGAYNTVVPDAPWFRGRVWRWLTLVGRLAPNVSLDDANAEARLLGDQLAVEFPQFHNGRTLVALPLNRLLVGPNDYAIFARAGWLLSGLVVVVLLVACANLVNLILARASSRSRDVAVRVALGATRSRIMSQLITESVVLGLAGGAVGLLIAHYTHQVLWSVRPTSLEKAAFAVGLNPRIVLFTIVVSIAAALLFGVPSALRASRTSVSQVLNETGRSPGLGRTRLRNVPVVAAIAMAVVAVAAAGLFLRAMQQAQRIDPGFTTTNVSLFTYALPRRGVNGAQARRFHMGVLDEILRDPRIVGAAIADRGPLQAGAAHTVNVIGHQPPEGTLGFVIDMAMVTPDYFRTLGLQLTRGRLFADADAPGMKSVAIVNETMAQRFWPGEDAVGRKFTSRASKTDFEIVGVVRDAKYETLGESPQPFFYLPLLQYEAPPLRTMSLLVSTRARADGGETLLREAARRVVPGVLVERVGTADDLLDQALWAPRMIAALVSVFGGLTLLLSTVGVYSVMAFTVAQRSKEIGVRIALGASRREIWGMVLGRGMALSLLGIAVGTLVTFVVTNTARGLLYGAEPRDPAMFVAVALLLVGVTLVACYVPARRASRIDPAVMLRE